MRKPTAPPPEPIFVPVAAAPWILPRRAEGPEMLAFQAAAALATLHPLVARPRADIPGALLRDRLALIAAESCLRIAGRAERAADLRDELHLLRPGDQPGPGGAVFDLWRRAVRSRLRGGAMSAAGRIPADIAEALVAQAAVSEEATPVTVASGVLVAALEAYPRDETGALILADMTLSRALGWEHPVPLLAPGLRRGDLRAGEAALRLACHRAVALQALEAHALAGDLARRAARLRAITPKLRAKGAREATRLFLTEDALSPGIALSPVIRGSSARMTDRAARRLCDRLVELGVARELTGRPSFRLYGL